MSLTDNKSIAENAFECILAQKLTTRVLRLSLEAYAKLFESSAVLQTLHRQNSINSGRAKGAHYNRADPEPNHPKWTSIFQPKFSPSNAIECIEQFIRLWKLVDRWHFRICYEAMSTNPRTESNSNDPAGCYHKFIVAFSLADSRGSKPFETCSVHFYIEPNPAETATDDGNGISYRFEGMRSIYSVNAKMYQFQELYLRTVINLKAKIQAPL